MTKSRKHVLVLGGSTFMGKSLLEKLNCSPQYKIFYINRGRKNNHVKSFMNLNYYNGNREDHTEFTKLLNYVSQKNHISQTNKWHCVIDFSAYKYTDIQSVRNALEDRCELYIFISSDSIYDVTKLSFTEEGHKEYMQIPELTPQQKQKAKENQSYGYNKLKCQMYLHKYKDIKKFPFLSLILPDVMGPFDDTGRYWSYIKWISKQQPQIQIDKESKQTKFSFVFSEDVINLILNILNNQLKLHSQTLCQSYNLACKQKVTLKGLLQLIVYDCLLRTIQVNSARTFYPSVDYGHLDLSKSHTHLNWKPTPIQQVIKITTSFFVNQAAKYKEQDQYASKKLKKKIKTE